MPGQTDQSINIILAQLTSISEKQDRMLAKQMHCEQRHDESSFIINSMIDNHDDLEAQVSLHTPLVASYAAVRKYIIAVSLGITGVAATNLYTMATKSEPPPTENSTPKTELKTVSTNDSN